MGLFEVDETSDAPMWVKLRQRIIYLIESGHYKPGDKLPTVRALATEVHVNMNTISRVYLSLASDGYIESTRGRGAFVKGMPEGGDGGQATEISGMVDDFIESCRDMGLGLDDIQSYVMRRVIQLKYQESGKGSEPAKKGANITRLNRREDRGETA